MSIKSWFLIPTLWATLCLGACSDDDIPDMTSKDSGPGKPDVQTVDQDGQVGPGGCEARCRAQSPYLCVTTILSGTSTCVECLTDQQCASNPGSLGAKCLTASSACTCDKDTDCAGKIHGTRCDSAYKMCSCSTDAECAAPLKCLGKLFGASVCGKPCTKDGDCNSSTDTRCAYQEPALAEAFFI